jgi:hypothetical protein
VEALVKISPDASGAVGLPRIFYGGAWGEAAFLLVALAVAFFGCLQPVWDPDSYWHLAVGKEIWRTGHLLRTETFSFEASQVPWDDSNWLAHILVDPLWKLGGYRALEFSVGFAGLLALLIGYLAVRARGASALAVMVAVAVWFTAFRGRFRFRPEALSLVLFAALVWLLASIARGGRNRRRFLWAIPPLFWLWIQVHGSWSYGAVLLAAVLAGGILDAGSGTERLGRIREAALVLGATGLLLLVTPYGPKLALFPLVTVADFGNPALVAMDEWKHSPWTLSTAPFLSAVLTLWAWFLYRALRFGRAWTDFLWTTSQALLLLLWVRYSSFGWIALLPLGCGVLDGIFSRFRKVAVPLACLLILPLSAHRMAGGLDYSPTGVDQPKNYPVVESAYLKNRGLSGNLFHTFVSGGYLNWNLYPGCRTFFDGRYAPFAPFLTDYNQSFKDPAKFAGFLGRYPFEIALVPYSGARLPSSIGPPRPAVLALFPKEAWTPVNFGPYGAVFLKNVPKFSDVAERDGFRLYFPGDEPHLAWEISQGRTDPAALRMEVDRALSRGLPAAWPSPALAFRDALARAFPTAGAPSLPILSPGRGLDSSPPKP